MDHESKVKSNPIAYELSRLACLLYSNAVLLGLPPDNGWHQRLVQRLVGVFEVSNLDQDGSFYRLQFWSLFTAAIAAYGLPERSFLESQLREAISKHRIYHYNAAQAILRDYLWSDDACGMGAADLWKCLEIEPNGDYSQHMV